MKMEKQLLEQFTTEKQGMVDGPFGSNLPASDYTEIGIPVIRGVNLSKGKKRFKEEKFVFVSPQTAKRLVRAKCIANDIVFTKKGTIGQVGIIPKKSKFKEFILSSNQMRMRVDSKKANPLFVYYFLSSPRSIKKITLDAMTTGVPKINLGYIRKFPVQFPPIETQTKIANILSAYDDLIENNNQRIRLLEEMAEEIYKEWFVRLRFPGYQNTPFFDKNGKEVEHGTVGALPEGWEKVRVENAFNILGGGTPSTSENSFWKNGTIDWFAPSDMTGVKNIFFENSSKKITPVGLAGSSAKLFPKGCVMMTSRATIGALGINLKPACVNQGFIVCIPNEKFSAPYIFHWLKTNTKLFKNFATGSTFLEISRGVFKRIRILKPAKEISLKFTNLINPLFEEHNLLTQKNEVLQQTRELLLPRLISGKLSVEGLPTAVEK